MDYITLKVYTGNCWQVAEVFKNHKSIAKINKFYNVTEDWIIIYDEIGGSGTGFRKGDVIERIYIGNSEFKRIRE